MLLVTAVQPLEGYWLRLTLSNGDVVERDVEELLWGGVFVPVRDRRDVFEAAYVEGGTVAWPGDVDIAPETLIWNGPGPAGERSQPQRKIRLRRP